jgi:DNA-binding MarR family transcriptional regulator
VSAEQADPAQAEAEPGADVYRAAAELREALRRFERRSEQLARAHGLTPQQLTLLLQIKGAPDGRERATVTSLASRLQLGQSTVTELVQRAEHAGLLRRTADRTDTRVKWLSLTAEGSKRLAAVVRALGHERDRLTELVSSTERLRPDVANSPAEPRFHFSPTID